MDTKMTVAELIAKLANEHPDTIVVFKNNQSTYRYSHVRVIELTAIKVFEEDANTVVSCDAMVIS
jgi:hypothetical protein